MTDTPDKKPLRPIPSAFGNRAARDFDETQKKVADTLSRADERQARKLRRDLDKQGRLPWLVRAAIWLVKPTVVSRGFLVGLGVTYAAIGGTIGALAVDTFAR